MKQPRLRLLSLLLACSALLLLSMITLLFPSGTRAASTTAAHKEVPAITGDLAADDPALIKAGNTYYVFSTGGGIQIRTSTDLVNWRYAGTVFSNIPSWVTDYVGSLTDL